MANKKLYVKVAQAIKDNTDVPNSLPIVGRDDLVIALCDIFQQDNPHFDPERFRAACGMEETEVEEWE